MFSAVLLASDNIRGPGHSRQTWALLDRFGASVSDTNSAMTSAFYIVSHTESRGRQMYCGPVPVRGSAIMNVHSLTRQACRSLTSQRGAAFRSNYLTMFWPGHVRGVRKCGFERCPTQRPKRSVHRSATSMLDSR